MPLSFGGQTVTHENRPVRNAVDASELSLVARLGVALCCFERYCRAVGLETKSIQDFSSYMWEWPLMITPGWFEEWEAKRTSLVDFGLGEGLPGDVEPALRDKGLDAVEFRNLVEATVEIIWGSFYAASDDRGSLKDLARVVSICERRGIRPPTLDVFAESRFKDGHGWGERISKDQRDQWRAASAA